MIWQPEAAHEERKTNDPTDIPGVLADRALDSEPALGSARGSASGRSGCARRRQKCPCVLQVKVVEGGESKAKPEDCRGTLVGPSVNPPDPFPGWGGFVGWESPIRLKNGQWLVGFNAGYWHASAPTPLRYPAKTLEEYHKLGLPADIVAPTGGRALLIRSSDEGKTWSKPTLLIDTPADDRHPAFVELRDGTILCSFFTYVGEPEGGDLRKAPELAVRVNIIRSFDGGRTWEQKPRTVRTPFLYDETDGPFVRLKDGSVLIAINGRPQSGPPDQAAVLRSTNRGKSWKLLSTIRSGTRPARDHRGRAARSSARADGTA